MTVGELCTRGGSILLILITLIQISPIKINPWSWIANLLGRALNAEVLAKLEAIEKKQKETEEKLDRHTHVDDDREATRIRESILRFNVEIIRDIKHTREDFIEILSKIDDYEDYCREHADYPNNRCDSAIKNIKRVYSERLVKHDFASI